MKIQGDIEILLVKKFKELGIILPNHSPLVPSPVQVEICSNAVHVLTNMTRKIN